MPNLTPEQIFNGYKKKEINKSSAIHYLKSYIEESDDYQIREESIKYLGELKPKGSDFFAYLENLLTSDDYDRIEAHAARILIEQYPNKAYEPIKWVIDHNHSGFMLESVANVLDKSPQKELKSLLQKILDKFGYVVFRDKIYLVWSMLRLNRLGIIDISEIKRLSEVGKRINHLNLSYNKITEIKGLETFTNLDILELEHNNISEIKGLENCRKLRYLHLNDNQISEIKGLETLENLNYLHLENNQITEVKGLENQKYLSYLNLKDNKITEINEQENLKLLSWLDLRNNQISEIKGLENLENLDTLYLDNNQISEIKGLENLIDLDNLYLSFNKITEIKGLENLNKLKTLDLTSNKIKNIKYLEKLSHITDLEFFPPLGELNVFLNGNPITEIKNVERFPLIGDLYAICNQELNLNYEPSEMPKKCLECTKKCKWKELRILKNEFPLSELL